MISFAVALVTALSLFVTIECYRRHRAPPVAYQLVRVRQPWYPRK